MPCPLPSSNAYHHGIINHAGVYYTYSYGFFSAYRKVIFCTVCYFVFVVSVCQRTSPVLSRGGLVWSFAYLLHSILARSLREQGLQSSIFSNSSSLYRLDFILPFTSIIYIYSLFLTRKNISLIVPYSIFPLELIVLIFSPTKKKGFLQT